MRKLSELSSGEKGYVIKVKGRGAFRRRLTEMGFVKGKEITVIKNAPLKDPIEYSILGYNLTLRRAEASNIIVSSKQPVINSDAIRILEPDLLNAEAIENFREKGRVINIALVGNPNAGKTTLFNHFSSSNEHTGNYSGVTVDSKTARVDFNGFILNLSDLPGTYSISAYSPEELYVRDYIINEVPDVVVNVVDASNLERNLYLTSQLIDMDIKVVLAFNMYDEVEKSNDKLDYKFLAKLLGIPIIPTVGAKGKGINNLFEKVVSLYNDQEPVYRHIHINYGEEIEKSINKIQGKIKVPGNYEITDKVSSRYAALRLLETDKHIHNYLKYAGNYNAIKVTAQKEVLRLKELHSEEPATLITAAKYGFISGALKETYVPGKKEKKTTSEVLDGFLTHKFIGFPFFFLFLWVMFGSTFTLGQYPMTWIENGIALLSDFIGTYMPEGSFKDLLIDGIIGGVGGVIVFLPNILILFMFISFMEDSGYMARAVFIMDRLMHRIGLHGKSFISLIMGFGCNVPAIMSTRTIEDRNNRLLTILINPFMSCSARLPVYLLVVGAVFPTSRGTILFSIYLLGILMAVVMALLFKKVIFKSEGTPFVMELPPYRMPTLRSIIKHMWSKGSQYLKKMGGVILLASVILWALGYFPRTTKHSPELLNKKAEVEAVLNNTVNVSQNNLLLLEEELSEIEKQLEAERLKDSYIGRIGQGIEPVIKPLGFDWKMGVSLLTGIAAKEVVVSTMGVLYQAEEGEEQNLVSKLRDETYDSGDKKGQKVFSPLVAITFVVFILIYFPCVAVIAAVKKEAGSIKWALFMMLYTTTLAWMVSFVVNKIGGLIIA